MQDLLAEGERVERELEVGRDRLVVTDRRVLSFTPDGEGPNYRAIARPNVDGVRIVGRSDTGHLISGVLYLLAGVATVAAGLWLETDGLLGTVPTGPGAAGLGVTEVIEEVGFWLGLLDDAVVVLGAALVLPAAYHLLRYQRSRRRVLTVAVAGDDDVDLPIERVADPTNAVEQLRLALDRPRDGERAPEWGTGEE